MTETPAPIQLVHMLTVPDSLIFIGGQTDYLRTRGFQTFVISSPGEELGAFGQDHDVETLGVEMSRAITPTKDLAALLDVWRCFRRLRPQIVHAGTPKGGLLGMMAARLAGVPVCIYQMRGLPLVTAQGLRRKLLWCCERLACSLSHRVLCDSESLRGVALAERLCSSQKAVVIAKGSCQGVDAVGRFNPEHHQHCRSELRAALGIPDNAVLIGFVGRIVRDKGIQELVTAWRQLRDEFPDLHLAIAGKPEPQDPISVEYTETLENDPQIHLLGFIADTPAFYAAMDVIVLPTYREGFPNVPLEAAAMGLPVVTTRVPGCVDAVEDGVTGLLVPATDAQELRVAIAQYITEPMLRRVHGQAGRNRVLEYFRPEIIWEGLHREYLTLLGKRSTASIGTGQS